MEFLFFYLKASSCIFLYNDKHFVVFLHRIIYNYTIDERNVFYGIDSLESSYIPIGRRRVKKQFAMLLQNGSDISGKKDGGFIKESSIENVLPLFREFVSHNGLRYELYFF